jgi:hypothetical protein
MAANCTDPAPAQPHPHQPPLLRSITAHQLAALIRGLDSRLLSIEYGELGGERALMYSFEVAGKRQPFYVALGGRRLGSIVDVYPEAGAQEEELRRRYGLVFQPPTADEHTP